MEYIRFPVMIPEFLAKHSSKFSHFHLTFIYTQLTHLFLAKLIEDGFLGADEYHDIQEDATQRLSANRYWQPRSKFNCQPRSSKFPLF